MTRTRAGIRLETYVEALSKATDLEISIYEHRDAVTRPAELVGGPLERGPAGEALRYFLLDHRQGFWRIGFFDYISPRIEDGDVWATSSLPTAKATADEVAQWTSQLLEAVRAIGPSYHRGLGWETQNLRLRSAVIVIDRHGLEDEYVAEVESRL